MGFILGCVLGFSSRWWNCELDHYKQNQLCGNERACQRFLKRDWFWFLLASEFSYYQACLAECCGISSFFRTSPIYQKNNLLPVAFRQTETKIQTDIYFMINWSVLKISEYLQFYQSCHWGKKLLWGVDEVQLPS